jgi:DNA-binding response OmpR family regulator
VSAVLVVEDDDRIRLSLVLALVDEGYEVHGSASAEAGLAAYRADPADAVLVDLMLPGMDGFECIRQFRQPRGQGLSRQQLLRRGWEYDGGDERLVDVHVGRLRQKIESDPSRPCRLVTVRGLGYKLQR